jgi:hypothetical protein
METSFNEALELLRKWQEEKRTIQCALFDDAGSSSSIIGRIELLDNKNLRITARSLLQSVRGDLIGLALDLDGAVFRFEDWRDAPPEQAEALRTAYDSFLFVALRGGSHCEIYAVKFPVEL